MACAAVSVSAYPKVEKMSALWVPEEKVKGKQGQVLSL